MMSYERNYPLSIPFRWTSEVDENEATYEEQRLFVQTKHVQNLVSYVQPFSD